MMRVPTHMDIPEDDPGADMITYCAEAWEDAYYALEEAIDCLEDLLRNPDLKDAKVDVTCLKLKLKAAEREWKAISCEHGLPIIVRRRV